MNTFANIPAYPTADMRVVVRPNFDTLYSSGWLDLTKEPVVASVPDTGGRYYLFPMLDMWTDVFASPGWRTNGTQAANFLVTPPGWKGSVPDGVQQIKLTKEDLRPPRCTRIQRCSGVYGAEGKESGGQWEDRCPFRLSVFPPAIALKSY